MLRIGIDLGGTKIEIIAIAEDGTALRRLRVATPQGDYAATVATLVELVRQTEAQLQQPCSVGVGIPGALSTLTGRVKNANSTWLIGQPLKQDLEAALGREVRLANDANCFTLSEATDGAGQGQAVVFGVILGTGVGGGIVANGQLLRGANDIAGEWGHNTLPGEEAPGPLCYCGRRGCVETYLCGPGLCADHLRVSGKTMTPAQIVQAAEHDADCAATMDRYEQRLARALAQVINLLDPDIIVLGGGLSNIGRLYQRLPLLWTEYVFSDQVSTRLAPNQHGDSSGVRGAAWLWR